MTLTFIHDQDIINVYQHTKFGDPNSNNSGDMNYCPVILVVTDRQTDRPKATPKSLPCISTGGLKNQSLQFITTVAIIKTSLNSIAIISIGVFAGQSARKWAVKQLKN